jgi:uncharacterized protein YbjT (DUF2867 family)
MALDSTFLEKFKSDALAAKSLGQRDAWAIAIGAAMSAGLPLFIQGEHFSVLNLGRCADSSAHELGGNAIHSERIHDLCSNASSLQPCLV